MSEPSSPEKARRQITFAGLAFAGLAFAGLAFAGGLSGVQTGW
jgi:hypothetical protein